MKKMINWLIIIVSGMLIVTGVYLVNPAFSYIVLGLFVLVVGMAKTADPTAIYFILDNDSNLQIKRAGKDDELPNGWIKVKYFS